MHFIVSLIAYRVSVRYRIKHVLLLNINSSIFSVSVPGVPHVLKSLRRSFQCRTLPRSADSQPQITGALSLLGVFSCRIYRFLELNSSFVTSQLIYTVVILSILRRRSQSYVILPLINWSASVCSSFDPASARRRLSAADDYSSQRSRAPHRMLLMQVCYARSMLSLSRTETSGRAQVRTSIPDRLAPGPPGARLPPLARLPYSPFSV